MKHTPARRISRGPRVKKLKKVVIQEQYVAITGNFRRALILGQFLYWTEHTFVSDLLLEEDNDRRIAHGEPAIAYKDGWIYKTAKDLLGELMLDCSAETLRREMKFLVDHGYFQTRRHPTYKMDATLQYRVDFLFLMRKLKENGFPLDGYYFSELGTHPDIDVAIPPSVVTIPHTEESNPLPVEAIPESTSTDITISEITSSKVPVRTAVRESEEYVTFDADRLFREVADKVRGEFSHDDLDNDQESL